MSTASSDKTRRRLLLIAFHYPPVQGSSGVHRSLAFSRYLPELGWDVTVLTVHSRAHENTRDENFRLVPPGVRVIRAPAWDAARHFALLGRYPSWLALPDRWASWIRGGTRVGLDVLRSERYDAIFSTFPISSAHVIGANLAERSGIPWVAEFRDPMAKIDNPRDPRKLELWTRIQDRALTQARRVVVTTPGAASFYIARYPDQPAERVKVIENGFDPAPFADLPPPAPMKPASNNERLVFLHSGIIYASERDPVPFFRALRALMDRGVITPGSIEIRLRASGSENDFEPVVRELGLAAVVTFPPALGYAEALREMMTASALLIFQGKVCNAQIPAKAYEYLYAGRPTVGLADPAGDTGRLLARFGVPGIAACENQQAIEQMLGTAITEIRAGRYPVPARESVECLSRRAGAQQLAEILDSIRG